MACYGSGTIQTEPKHNLKDQEGVPLSTFEFERRPVEQNGGEMFAKVIMAIKYASS